MRESGTVFALPSYGFVVAMLVMIGSGVFKVWGEPTPHQNILAEPGAIGSESSFLLFFVALRAFSAGCVALTGVEAISNGVQAFRKPEARNAAMSLRWLAAMMIVMFLGTGYLVQHLPEISLYATKNPEYRTVVSQLAAFTFGVGGLGFYAIQFATAAILILAANTAFADFPRLGSLLARDGYLPRPLARQGDRLVFQNGIILLAAFAIALVWYFHGELDLLLPLYAVGVFTAFTLSQSGMVRHWFKLRDKGWTVRAAINGVGGLVTGVVALVILVTKFPEGAWMVLLLITATGLMLYAIKRRYRAIANQLALGGHRPGSKPPESAILLVPRVHRGILFALDYANSLHGDVRAVHVTIDPKTLPEILSEWEHHANGMPLVVIGSPFRSLLEPILDYIDQMLADEPNRVVTVIVPEAVAMKWVHKFLQENVAQQIKNALGKRRNVVVATVRYFLD